MCFHVLRLELLLQRANKFQNLALDCEEKITLAKNTLQAVSTRIFNAMSNMERAGWSILCDAGHVAVWERRGSAVRERTGLLLAQVRGADGTDAAGAQNAPKWKILPSGAARVQVGPHFTWACTSRQILNFCQVKYAILDRNRSEFCSDYEFILDLILSVNLIDTHVIFCEIEWHYLV